MKPSTTKSLSSVTTVLFDMDTEIAALESRLAKTQAIKQGMMQELLTGGFALKLRNEFMDRLRREKMLDSEILEKLQGASIEERIAIIEAILRSLKHDMRSAPSQQIPSKPNPLRGKVIRYDNPYEPVAAEDW